MPEARHYGYIQRDYAVLSLNTMPVHGLTCQEVQLKGEFSD